MSEDFIPQMANFGWVEDKEAVAKVVAEIEASGQKAMFADAAPKLMMGDDDHDVFFWNAELKVLGHLEPSFDQKDVGSCVGNGWARGVQDLMLWEIISEEREEWPGAGVAVEPIYGGSRVEVGGGSIRGDGSIGAWASRWVNNWGILLRKSYEVSGQKFDLTKYSVDLCRTWGNRGVPDVLEPLAKEHPVTAVAMVQNGNDCWAAIGAGKPIPICSNQGFTTRLVNGFCEPSGQWNHCMLIRGRFIHPTRGKCFVIQNSWGSYLSGERFIETQSGRVEMPEGCFATTLSVVDRIARQEDSFAIAGLNGWEKTIPVDYTP